MGALVVSGASTGFGAEGRTGPAFTGTVVSWSGTAVPGAVLT